MSVEFQTSKEVLEGARDLEVKSKRVWRLVGVGLTVLALMFAFLSWEVWTATKETRAVNAVLDPAIGPWAPVLNGQKVTHAMLDELFKDRGIATPTMSIKP